MSRSAEFKEYLLKSPKFRRTDSGHAEYDAEIKKLLEEWYGPESSRSKNSCRDINQIDPELKEIYDEFGITDIMMRSMGGGEKKE